MVNFNLLKAKIENNKIILEIPTGFLIALQEERKDTPYRITNTEKMLEWIKNNIFNFYDDPDIPQTEIESFINNMFEEAYESGEPWLEGIV